MANENEKNPSALEELRQLKRTDRIKSLNIHEPELRDFHAENVFHIDEEPQKKTIFGKRSARTHVKINQNMFLDRCFHLFNWCYRCNIHRFSNLVIKNVLINFYMSTSASFT